MAFTVTLTIPDADVPRLDAAARGLAYRGGDRDQFLADYLVRYISDKVVSFEENRARATVAANLGDPPPPLSVAP